MSILLCTEREREEKVDENVLSLQNKTVPSNLTFSPDGKLFAAVGQDRKVSSNQPIKSHWVIVYL